ncbi:hypothetical protein [Mesorhizobium salmacidum]|uniref:Uncharacterized protein n=1 Tax=Mesorhizobium salmacidum TaxID=3015171 RepID=A0ABU8KR94_9HYPH
MKQVEAGLHQINEICEECLGQPLSVSEQAEAENEIRTIVGNIFEALDDAGQSGISDYIQEKLTGLTTFALMAVGSADRDSYSDDKILENISHFAYLVRTRT